MEVKLNENKLNRIIKESVRKVLNEGFGGSPIEKWNYWCANYDYQFIEKAWEGDDNMINHLQKKFDYYYEQVGPYGVMLKFYLNLDRGNRRILEEYVERNYNP